MNPARRKANRLTRLQKVPVGVCCRPGEHACAGCPVSGGCDPVTPLERFLAADARLQQARQAAAVASADRTAALVDLRAETGLSYLGLATLTGLTAGRVGELLSPTKAKRAKVS